jgi:spermidine synthase
MGSGPAVLLAAAFAGVATLAGELLWMRGLGRGVGTSYEAVAVVAGLVLAGLGLGSWLGARHVARARRGTRQAAVALLAGGTLTALSPLWLAGVPDWNVALLDAFGLPGGGGVGTALLLAVPLVLPATLALGAAFPALVRARRAGPARAGTGSGAVLAANTGGAVLAVALIPSVCEAWGETLALRAAGGCALAGSLLLLLVDRAPAGAEAAAPEATTPPPTPAAAEGAGGLGLVLAAAGSAALTAQMAWLRLLQPLAGAHLLGAALLLGPLLLALAAGAALGGLLADRVRHPARLLPLLLAAAGVLVLLSLPLAGNAPLRVLQAGADGHVQALVLAFLLTTGPASLVLGALLPVAVRVRAAREGTAAVPAGRLYAADALGALAGSAIAAAWLLPTLGAERTLLAAAVLLLAVAVWRRVRLRGGRRVTATALCALPLPVLLLPGVLGWLLASGPSVPELIAAQNPRPPGLVLRDDADLALYAELWAGRRAVRPTSPHERPTPLFEGRGGRLALIEEPDGVVGLRRGAVRESVFDPDRSDVPSPTEYALGLVPALLVPDARRALVVGHGAGWTCEAVLAGCDAQVEVAEIDPAVLDAARTWRGLRRLPAEAGGRAHLVCADGRVLLRRAAHGPPSRRYDLIASQPSNPWIPTSGHLFTQEAFTCARDALTPHGVMAQWLNLYDLTPDLLESALASFRAAFPACWVLRFPDEIVLLGFRGPPALDAARWEAFFGASNPRAAGARRAGFEDAGDLFKHLVLDARGVAQVVPPQTRPFHDDRPRLELALARRRLERAAPRDLVAVLARGFPPDVEVLLPHNARRERWLQEAAQGWLDDGDAEAAAAWCLRLAWGATPGASLVQVRALQAAGDGEQAWERVQRARARWPARGDVLAAWIRVAADRMAQLDRRGRFLIATDVEKQVAGGFARDGRVLGAAGDLQRRAGNAERAVTLLERAVAAKDPPAPPGERIALARLLLSRRPDDANEERAIGLLSKDPDTWRQVDALDLLVRLTSTHGLEEQAKPAEEALATLQRTRGLGLWRAAGRDLVRRQFGRAVADARAAVRIWPLEAAVHERAGLALLAARAAARAGGAPFAGTLQDAVDAFDSALELSDAPRALRAQLVRIFRWYGVDASRLPPLETDHAE